VWLMAEPLLYRTHPERSLFRDIAAGRWGRIARLMVAGLVAGILWETYNAGDRGKWIYTVPFLEHLKLFEMPPLGFAGFTFFALEVWTLYHLLAPLTRPAAILPTVVFAALALHGMERWTITSYTPRLHDLPGVGADVRARLAAADLADPFRLALVPPESVAIRSGIGPETARAAQAAAQLATLRGIGTTHAKRLAAVGVASVPQLARADPDSLWHRLQGSSRPTPAEVRVWVRAARAAVATHGRW
jgi:hypothetical protein